jgi:hypothetical protein
MQNILGRLFDARDRAGDLGSTRHDPLAMSRTWTALVIQRNRYDAIIKDEDE